MPKQSEDINMQYMVGASNKPFDYMACGLPLLVSKLPDWVSTFVEPGYARACDPDDPDSIEAELRWYLEHSDERREIAERCIDKIRESWNYETMFAPVVTEMENGLSQKPNNNSFIQPPSDHCCQPAMAGSGSMGRIKKVVGLT
jgi:spore maturation protein CgeB